MGIKITSISMTRESYQVPTNEPHRMFEAGGSPFVTGEFESTVKLEVGQRFAVNENRFDNLKGDDHLQGVARVTSVRELPLQSPVEISTFLIPRQWRPRDERTWTGTFEMEGEVSVVAE